MQSGCEDGREQRSGLYALVEMSITTGALSTEPIEPAAKSVFSVEVASPHVCDAHATFV